MTFQLYDLWEFSILIEMFVSTMEENNPTIGWFNTYIMRV